MWKRNIKIWGQLLYILNAHKKGNETSFVSGFLLVQQKKALNNLFIVIFQTKYISEVGFFTCGMVYLCHWSPLATYTWFGNVCFVLLCAAVIWMLFSLWFCLFYLFIKFCCYSVPISIKLIAYLVFIYLFSLLRYNSFFWCVISVQRLAVFMAKTSHFHQIKTIYDFLLQKPRIIFRYTRYTLWTQWH